MALIIGLFISLLIFALFKLRKFLKNRRLKCLENKGYIDYYYAMLEPREAFERLLGHPFAFQSIKERYYRTDAKHGELSFDEEVRQIWGPPLLAYLNITTHLSKKPLNEIVTVEFEKNWYRLGLMKTTKEDAILPAMAFAIAKLSFALQLSRILGFIDEAPHRRLMALNAIRARDCFSSWKEYAYALVEGRNQYIQHGHSDYIGTKVSIRMFNEWFNEKDHPWNQITWPEAGDVPY